MGTRLHHGNSDLLFLGPPVLFSVFVAGLSHRLFRSTAIPLLLSFISAFGAATLIPSAMPARGPGRLTACKSNLKNIATACEMYASDNEGLYPASLDRLPAGQYLKTIPTCTAAGKDTYSSSYTVSPDGKHFSMLCQGDNHASARARPDFPQYSSEAGLIERP